MLEILLKLFTDVSVAIVLDYIKWILVFECNDSHYNSELSIIIENYSRIKINFLSLILCRN